MLLRPLSLLSFYQTRAVCLRKECIMFDCVIQVKAFQIINFNCHHETFRVIRIFMTLFGLEETGSELEPLYSYCPGTDHHAYEYEKSLNH